MKFFTLFLMVLLTVACGKGGGAGSSSSQLKAVINPEIYGGQWQHTYSTGPDLYADQLSVVDDVVTVETYRNGATLVGTQSWTIVPLTANTLRVNDGVDTFVVTYTIADEHNLEICYQDGSCDQFTR